MEGTFVALRPFQYGPEFPADMLDLHQVFEMRNEQNDEQLLRLRYVASLAPKTSLLQCGKCGKKFTDSFALNRHGKIRHEPQHAPRIVDDTLGKIDTDDPGQLEARARQLQRDMKRTLTEREMVSAGLAVNPEAALDAAVAQEEKLLSEIAPIPWEKTLAAQKENAFMVPEVQTAPAMVRKSRVGKKRGRK